MEAIKFTISEPCHQDWNMMMPEEKGRFCDNCSKTVHDFSDKTPAEIQKYFLEHSHEKVCGRFRQDQLNKPVRIEISYRSLENRMTFSQIFLLSLLIVFGSTLFSCTTHDDKTIGEFNLSDSVFSELTEGDSAFSEVIGEVKEERSSDNINVVPLSNQIKVEREDNQLFDTTINLPQVEISGLALHSVDLGFSVMGLIALTRCEVEEINTITDSNSVETKIADQNIDLLNESTILFPNPAHDNVNLKFHVNEEKIVEAKLFDLNGRLIRIIMNIQQIPIGESSIKFDISDLPPATYLLRLTKDDEAETKRLVVM